MLTLSFVATIPFIVIAEKYHRMKPVFLGAIVCIIISQFLLWLYSDTLFSFVTSLTLFFVGFNLLEASLPSLIAKTAPVDSKGTAMGIYSSAQFFGIFLGGSLGGWLYEQHQHHAVFLMTTSLAMIWLLLASFMAKPKAVSSRLLNLNAHQHQSRLEIQQQLQSITGITEAFVDEEKTTAYLKIDKSCLDEETLTSFPPQQHKNN